MLSCCTIYSPQITYCILKLPLRWFAHSRCNARVYVCNADQVRIAFYGKTPDWHMRFFAYSSTVIPFGTACPRTFRFSSALQNSFEYA